MDTIRPMAADATALFKAGNFAAAAAAYGSLLEGLTGKAAAVGLTNRAACHAKLGDMNAAEVDSRLAIEASPEYARAHLRLASSLPIDHDDAASAVVAAIALSAQPANDETQALYQAIASASASSRALRLDHVNISRVTSVATTIELNAALGRDGVIVLRPGTYQLGRCISGSLVGVGSVEVTANMFCSHALYVKCGLLQVVNVSIIGGGEGAAACCCDAGTLRLVSCRVIDYAEAGLLIAGHCTASLLSCVFQRLVKHAIEVREGASLEACDCRLEACRQGVSAYGGALSVKLQGCTIRNCSNEGVLVSGSDVNAATRAQGKKKQTAVTERAEAWGRERRLTLTSSITDCTISHNGNFGISIDYGAQVVVQRCALQMNDPYNILVKGGSDASISASQFTFAGRSSKSPWAQGTAGGANLKLTGVHVAINYGGEVQVFGCAFSGTQELGIDEESTSLVSTSKTFGTWTKPALVLENHFDCGKSLPSIAELDAEAQQITTPRSKSSAAAAAEPAAGTLSRIGWTFQQASWSPTGHEFYAIGNTKGFDVTAGMLASASHARILLAGCGDPRNLVATAAAAPGGVIDFVMNDGNVSMLARDAVLLHLMATAPPETMAETVLAVWSDHGLSTAHASTLQASCTTLAEEPWPDWLRASAGLEGGMSNAAAEAPVREACRAWANCSITLAKLLLSRDAVQQPLLRAHALKLSLEAVGGNDRKLQEEVKALLRSGSLTNHSLLSSPNVTLLLSPSLQYTLYFSSSIVRALPLTVAPHGTSLATRLLSSLAPQLQDVAARLRSGTLNVSLVLGDILVVGADAATDARFDFIDCSNVADYVSVTSLLQICAPLLSRSSHARVRMESMLLYNSVNEAAKTTFAQDATGLTADTLTSLLGVRFVSSHELPGGVLRMEWASATASEQGPVSAGELLLYLAPRFSKVLADGPSEQDRQWHPIGGGPLALTHLLKVSAGPAVARTLLDALLRSASCQRAKLFQWELTMHVPRTPPELVAISFDAGDSGKRLMFHHEDPLMIAFSRKPLELGDTPFGQVHQLLSAFHWDEYCGIATFPLPASLAAKCATLHVTLCALGRKGLDALSSSRFLSDQPQRSLTTAWRSLDPQPQVLDTSSVIDGKKEEAGWKAAVVSAPLFVAVDVLTPKALLESKAREVSVAVAGCELRVIVKDKEGGEQHGSYAVQLPDGVVQGTPMRSKMSRSIGLICMKIAWVG